MGEVKKREGLFVTLEGLDKVGKTTQRDILLNNLSLYKERKLFEGPNLEKDAVDLLEDLYSKKDKEAYLRLKLNLMHIKSIFNSDGRSILFTREPGGTSYAEKIRRVILEIDEICEDPEDITEAYLFAAARAQHVRRLVLPNLEKGNIVVSDRYIDSSLLFQGIAGGLGIKDVYNLNKPAINGVLPDMTFFLTLDFDKWIERIRKSEELDRMETKPISYHEKMYEGAGKIISMFPDRIVQIDANRTPEEIALEISDRLVNYVDANYEYVTIYEGKDQLPCGKKLVRKQTQKN